MLSEHINRKIDALQSKTSDLAKVLNLLLQDGIISGVERDDIDEIGSDYRKAGKLWKILGAKDDGDVPKIIACFRATTCAKFVPDYLAEYKPLKVVRQESTVPLDDGDFFVESKHAAGIAKKINTVLNNRTQWEHIKSTMFTQEMINTAGENSDLRLDIQNSIKAWVSKAKSKDERLYSVFVEAIREEANNVAELLENADVREELRKVK